MTCERLGRQEEADLVRTKMLERMPNHLLQNPDDARAHVLYGIALAALGRRDEALRECSTALELSPGDCLMLYNCTCLYARLGEPQQAIDSLRKAIAAGDVNFAWLKQDPDLNSLRDNPEFIALTSGH